MVALHCISQVLDVALHHGQRYPAIAVVLCH
jgi:hypothetical protein